MPNPKKKAKNKCKSCGDSGEFSNPLCACRRPKKKARWLSKREKLIAFESAKFGFGLILAEEECYKLIAKTVASAGKKERK